MASPYLVDPNSQSPVSAGTPDPKKLAQIGWQAIQTGEISPQEALKNYKALGINSPYGIPGGTPGPETEQQSQADAQIATNAAANQATAAAEAATRTPMDDLSPVEKGSGLTKQNKEGGQSSDLHSTTEVGVLGDAEYQQIQKRREALPEYQAMVEGNKNLENMIQMESQRPQQIDYKPFAALIDSWTGGHQAEAGPKIETPQERSARILQYAQKLQQDKKDAFNTIASDIRAQKGGSTIDTQKNMELWQQMQMAQDPVKFQKGIMDTNVRKFIPVVEAGMKDLRDSNASMQEAQRMLGSGQSVNDTTFRDKFLKAMIGGRVTNYDLMRQTGDTSLAEKASQLWESFTKGTFTPKNRAEYQDALRVISDANQHEAALRLNRYRKIGVTALGIDPERVEPVVSGYGIGEVAPQVLDASNKKSHKTVDHPVDTTKDGEKILVIRIADGQRGKLSVKDFDPKKYKKVSQ